MYQTIVIFKTQLFQGQTQFRNDNPTEKSSNFTDFPRGINFDMRNGFLTFGCNF